MKLRRFPKSIASLLVATSVALFVSGCTSGHDRHQFSYKKKYKTLPSPTPVKSEVEVPMEVPVVAPASPGVI